MAADRNICSRLSVTAPVFVPSNGTVRPLETTPRFLFNCYPFVNEQDARNNGIGATAGNVQNVKQVPFYSPPYPVNSGNYGYQPPTGLRYAAGVDQYREQANFYQQPFSHPALGFNIIAPSYYDRASGSQHLENSGNHSRYSYKTQSNKQEPGSRKNKFSHNPAKERHTKVSIGIQNDPNRHVPNHNKAGAKSKLAVRTVILVNAAAQTDFCSEIAYHTLEQIPNALYKPVRKRTSGLPRQQGIINETTDSEELDHSDSGYSSPLHRKNLISSGTDAAIHSDITTNSHFNESTVTSCHNTQNNLESRLTFLPPSKVSYASAVVSSKKSNSGERESNSQTSVKLLNNDKNLLQDGAESEEENVTHKKKRKRGRRRRRKTTDENSRPVDNPNKEGSSPALLSEEPAFDLFDSIHFPSFTEARVSDNSQELKLSGKRKKRTELANQAALEEQLEIELEQQALKVVNQSPSIVKPPAATSNKKSKQNLSVNLIDLVKPKTNYIANAEVPSKKPTNATSRAVLNPLDSTAPSVKRGKEREMPKAKKPSALKKVILKEREEKKRLRYIGDGPVDILLTPDSSLNFASEPEDADVSVNVDNDDDMLLSDLDDPTLGGEGSDMDTPQTQDLSPVSQNSPISMGLLTPPTPNSAAVNDSEGNSSVIDDIIQKIHSRRFREYCNQVLDKDIDETCKNLLQSLVKFQDRLYHKDPIKAKTKRRLVLGLREVTKHLKLRRIKLVIISPNLEKIQSKGGLDDALNNITELCREQDVPFVFALGRRQLGRACAKMVPVSVVGVFNYQGAEAMYKELMELTAKARADYIDMIDGLAKEVEEYGGLLKSSSGLIFAHLGHSRTPSGCSASSFISSLLSEPLPEQQPDHSKIPAASTNNIVTPTVHADFQSNEAHEPLTDDIYDIDEGNEADTEDNDSNPGFSDSHPASNLCTTMPTPAEESEPKGSHFPSTKPNGSPAIERHSLSSSVETITQSISHLNIKKNSKAQDVANRRSSFSSQLATKSHLVNDMNETPSSSSLVIEETDTKKDSVSHMGASASVCKLDMVMSWVRDVDINNRSMHPEVLLDDVDVEFNATLSACEANTDMLISPSISNTTVSKQT